MTMQPTASTSLISHSMAQPGLGSAPQTRGLRIALAGKGGAGKSAIAATLARTLARRGHSVLALDVDTLPGLAFSLGLSLDEASLGELPADLAERVPERGWVLRDGVEVVDLVKKYAVAAPDGVRFLQLGKLPDKVKPGSTVAFRYVMEEFRDENWSLIGDMAAGTRQPFFGWGDFAELILLVSEPSAKAVLSIRRLAKLAQPLPPAKKSKDTPSEETPSARPMVGIIANKLRSAAELAQMEHLFGAGPGWGGLPLLATLPYDEELAEAEREKYAPLDAVPFAPAVVAIQELAVRLEQFIGEQRQQQQQQQQAH